MSGKTPMPSLSAENTEELFCVNPLCKHNIFQELTKLRKASRLLTGAPKDIVVSIPAVVCAKCGTEFVQPKDEEVKSSLIV
jgi:hypothetical protein